MSLKLPLGGRLEDFPLHRVLAEIARLKISCTLTISGDTDTVDIRISDGLCVGVVSHYPRKTLRLGHLMVLRGYCTEAQVETLLEQQQQDLILLGQLACDADYLSGTELARTLEDQMLLNLYECLTWTRGVYCIQLEDSVPYDHKTIRPVKLEPLCQSGPEILKDIPWIRERIVDERIIPERIAGIRVIPEGVQVDHDSGPASVLTSDQDAVYACVDGVRTVQDICDSVHLFKWNALKALIDLQDAGVITLPEKVKAPKTKPAEDTDDERSPRFEIPKPDVSGYLGLVAKVMGLAVAVVILIIVIRNWPETQRASGDIEPVDAPFPVSQTVTAFNVREIQMALVTFHTFEETYPDNLQELVDRMLVRDRAIRDGWERPFEYRVMDEGYVLRSFGPDRTPDTGDDVQITGRASDHVFGCFFPGTPVKLNVSQTQMEGETS